MPPPPSLFTPKTARKGILSMVPEFNDGESLRWSQGSILVDGYSSGNASLGE